MSKWTVRFDQERCKGCELCISVCPKNILKINGESINSQGYNPVEITDIEECIGCQSCAIMCPDLAITIFKEGIQ